MTTVPLGPVDLSSPRRIHLVGVGGAGMSAIASVLGAMGHTVTGSDLKSSPTTQRLAAAGVVVHIGHRADHIGEAEIVMISTAIADGNPEVVEARRRGIRVLSRAEATAAVAACRRCVAVSGTHGKTTTTSMLALILVEAGLRPSFLIGGDINEIGTNAVWDTGEWLAIEADESDGTFLALDPEVAVVTNIEADHLDFYGGFPQLVAAFDQFCRSRPGGVVVGGDDAVAAELGRAHGADLVGMAADATYRIEDLRTGRDGVSFALRGADGVLGTIAVPVMGANIARNAAVATVAALRVGAGFDDAVRAFARFAGVARRFEVRGEEGGVRFVDDYAHLPTEVRSVIEAAGQTGPQRVVVVFQPHRYSRIEALGAEFADAFAGADVVLVTDIFAAGEQPRPGVTGRLVAEAVQGRHPELDVTYIAGRPELRAHLAAILRPGDLCLTLGAGDLTSLPDELLGGGHMVTDVAGALDQVAAALGPRAVRHAPLGARTTYRVGGTASVLVDVESEDDLAAVHAALASAGRPVPVLVLGNGSNMLVADGGFDGVVVVPGAGLSGVQITGTVVRAGGGAPFPLVARRTAAAGLRGLEWAVGVPGSVGGAVRMNAGGHGSDTAAVLVRSRVVDLVSGLATEVDPARLAFGYRRSSLGAAELVVWAEFALTAGERADAEAVVADIVRWRRAHQPGGSNAGSVFTNPEGDAAGRLVEAAGLKGFRLGSARVSEKHANFIQADDGGRADDVRLLIEHVRRVVGEGSGVVLVPEVCLVGFNDEDEGKPSTSCGGSRS